MRDWRDGCRPQDITVTGEPQGRVVVLARGFGCDQNMWEELLRGRRVAEEARTRAEADRARLQEALAVLQQSLVPDSLPPVPGMERAAYYHTASLDRLGGDFYDVFPIDGKRFAFFLGDVCGKGPQAAGLTSLTRYTLRAAALCTTPSPSRH
ncbi:PP2C family protein-serine/threonine phosphatase [Streptomyces griseofuscus]|uniref:PP2C family protein-serine/threonine phosphatase n=1 Tax=Streptomyces griseofuscus TaxID=146922 RepID=UPI0036AE45AF